MYAKIINNDTKLCNVGFGTDVDYYKSIGMQDLDVEQSSTGEWYIKGFAPITVPTVEEIKQRLLNAVDNYLNDTVKQRGYDSILSACSYAFDDTDEVFSNEGKKCLAWRSRVYRKCYDIMAEVEAGERNIPTEEELIAELPVLEW